MPIEAPISETYDPEEEGGLYPVKGNYHLKIVDCDEEGGRKNSMKVVVEVLAGNPANQEGRRIVEYFYKSMRAMARIHQFAIAIGLITAEQLKDMKERGQSPSYDFNGLAPGRHFLAEVIEEEYDGKIRSKLHYNNIFSVYDERCASWPKHLQLLQKDGYDLSKLQKPVDGQSAQQQQAAPTTTQQSTQATPTAPANQPAPQQTGDVLGGLNLDGIV